MKTLLIGAGAIGGTIGTLLKNAGYDIRIMCLNDEIKNMIEENKFTLTGAKGEYHEEFTCYSSYGQLGDEKFDYVIIATKIFVMPKVAALVLPFIREDTLVVGMQNGICTAELAEVVGDNRAVGCMLGFGATRISDCEVNMTSKGKMVIGLHNGAITPELNRLADMLSKVLPTSVSSDIRREQYSKLIVNSCINSCAAITGKTLGVIINDKRARKLFLAVAREAMRIAKAMNFDVPPYAGVLNYKLLMLADNPVWNSVAGCLVFMVSKMYGNVKPSTLQSLEHGEKTEIDIFNGYFVKKGAELGIDVPVCSKIVDMIHEIENGEREMKVENLDEFKGMI